MKKLIFILIITSYSNGWAQNLVPNPSFEEHIECPITGDEIWSATPWESIYGIGSYYHECGINGWSIPVSNYGGGYARTGEAYVGTIFWYSLGNEGYFIGVELTQSLIVGKRYTVEFYISMMDSSWYAIKNIGAYFSSNQPPQNSNILLSYEPQIKYNGSEFLSDKVGWMKIEGSFIASGGEQFITIGNFDGFSNSDTLFVGNGGIPPEGEPDFWKCSGYFIDDVSVMLDTTTSINELERVKLDVYPNPAKDEIYISITGTEEVSMSFELWTMLGQNSKSVTLKLGMNVINTAELSDGVYHYIVKINDETKQTGKQVIIE